jgi:hypothetical protein
MSETQLSSLRENPKYLQKFNSKITYLKHCNSGFAFKSKNFKFFNVFRNKELPKLMSERQVSFMNEAPVS